MTARESVRLCGPFSKLHIKRADIFTIFITEGMRYLRSSMSSVWTRVMGIVTSLRNGRRFFFCFFRAFMFEFYYFAFGCAIYEYLMREDLKTC
jgi:hypothetical protein